MKGPFSGVNMLPLGGREGKRSLSSCCSQRSGSAPTAVAWVSPAQLPLCQSSCQRNYVFQTGPMAAFVGRMKQQPGSCQPTWHVNWPQQTSTGGKHCRKQGRHLQRGENISTGSDGKQQEVWGSHTASNSSWLPGRSEVLNRAPGQWAGCLCVGTGLCDVSHSPGTQGTPCCVLVVHVTWSVRGQAPAPSPTKSLGVCSEGFPC